MPCMCGGCRDCLAAQGYVDTPEACPVCDTPLDEDNTSGFCSCRCERLYVAEMGARDSTLVLQLAEEAALADSYRSQEQARHDAMMRAFLLGK